jgi:hypothetical protein
LKPPPPATAAAAPAATAAHAAALAAHAAAQATADARPLPADAPADLVSICRRFTARPSSKYVGLRRGPREITKVYGDSSWAYGRRGGGGGGAPPAFIILGVTGMLVLS